MDSSEWRYSQKVGSWIKTIIFDQGLLDPRKYDKESILRIKQNIGQFSLVTDEQFHTAFRRSASEYTLALDQQIVESRHCTILRPVSLPAPTPLPPRPGVPHDTVTKQANTKQKQKTNQANTSPRDSITEKVSRTHVFHAIHALVVDFSFSFLICFESQTSCHHCSFNSPLNWHNGKTTSKIIESM